MELDGAQVDVARLVKTARYAAKQTQASLAKRAGVSRATVAAIETGARSPSWAMLTALLAAAGKQVRLELEPLDDDVRRAVAAHVADTGAADDLSMTVSLMEGLVGLGEDGRFLLEYWLRTFTVRFVPAEEAGRAVTVVGEHAPLRVQPLHEIETTDRDAARVLRLLREQAQDAR